MESHKRNEVASLNGFFFFCLLFLHLLSLGIDVTLKVTNEKRCTILHKCCKMKTCYGSLAAVSSKLGSGIHAEAFFHCKIAINPDDTAFIKGQSFLPVSKKYTLSKNKAKGHSEHTLLIRRNYIFPHLQE